jgi:hypothetical protein
LSNIETISISTNSERTMIIESYVAHICSDTNKQPVCVLLALDGVVTPAPERGCECAASIKEDSLLLIVDGQEHTFAKLAPEIVALFRDGKQLLIKHDASGFEALVPVTL